MTKEEKAFLVWINKQLKQIKSLSKEDDSTLSALMEFKKRDGTSHERL